MAVLLVAVVAGLAATIVPLRLWAKVAAVQFELSGRVVPVHSHQLALVISNQEQA